MTGLENFSLIWQPWKQSANQGFVGRIKGRDVIVLLRGARKVDRSMD